MGTHLMFKKDEIYQEVLDRSSSRYQFLNLTNELRENISKRINENNMECDNNEF